MVTAHSCHYCQREPKYLSLISCDFLTTLGRRVREGNWATLLYKYSDCLQWVTISYGCWHQGIYYSYNPMCAMCCWCPWILVNAIKDVYIRTGETGRGKTSRAHFFLDSRAEESLLVFFWNHRDICGIGGPAWGQAGYTSEEMVSTVQKKKKHLSKWKYVVYIKINLICPVISLQ